MPEEQKLFKVTIDNITIDVPAGTTVLNAARKIGGEVLRRQCVITASWKAAAANAGPALWKLLPVLLPIPGQCLSYVASCRTNVMDGMVVKNITSEKVIDARKGVVEFLLINHPLDCPICDQAGECSLQDLGYDHGAVQTRYEFKRRTFVREDIGPYIQLHMTRCILCYRCTYIADQITDHRVHGILDRGDHSDISTYISKAIDNDFSGNMIDVCPVGALTDRTFRFKNRVWFLKPVDAHRDCDKCCGKVTLWNRGNEVYRVTSRKDEWGEVQSYDGKPGWICNTCRFDKKLTADWIIEGPTKINRHSVISANHYEVKVQPPDPLDKVLFGRKPLLLLDIHDTSEVNRPEIDLSKIPGPATSATFTEHNEQKDIDEAGIENILVNDHKTIHNTK